MMADREILTLLRAIDAKLDRLIESTGTPPRSLRQRDRAAMAKILPVLVGNFQGTFSTWELLDAATAPDAVGSNLRIALAGRDAKELGQLFGRSAGYDIAGFKLVRIGEDAHGNLWQAFANTLP